MLCSSEFIASKSCSLPDNTVKTVEGSLLAVQTEKNVTIDNSTTVHVSDFIELLEATVPDHPNPDNPRFSYMSSSINRETADLWETGAHKQCQLERNAHNQAVGQLPVDPNGIGRTMFGRDDISITLRGDVLEISDCIRVNVSRIFTDYRLPSNPNICFKFPPAQLAHNDELWFVSPGSHDLVQRSVVVDCKEITNLAVFKTGDDSFSQDGVLDMNLNGFLDNSSFSPEPAVSFGSNGSLYNAPVAMSSVVQGQLAESVPRLYLFQEAQTYFDSGLTDDPDGFVQSFPAVIDALGDNVVKVGTALFTGVRNNTREVFHGVNGFVRVSGESARNLVGTALGPLGRFLTLIMVLALAVLVFVLYAKGLIRMPSFCKKDPLKEPIKPSEFDNASLAASAGVPVSSAASSDAAADSADASRPSSVSVGN